MLQAQIPKTFKKQELLIPNRGHILIERLKFVKKIQKDRFSRISQEKI